ncbi:MAG: DUF2225 domain-containing protein [Spartobacteria bacterium]|nr:DUF2225 domain-containing protein [Spartobacteria bacterium]
MSSDPKQSEQQPKAFLKPEIECPVCHATHQQYQLKSRMVWERDRDIDLQPRQFYWTKKSLAHIHPPLYYMWHCPSCYFTAGFKFYEEPVKDTSLSQEKFQAAVREALTGHDKGVYLAQALARDINYETMDFFQAIKLHLLAVYIHTQIDALAQKDAMNIGRYALRLAWLYRDLDQMENNTQMVEALASLHDDLASCWPERPVDEMAALAMAVASYNTAFDKSTAIRTAIDAVNVLQLIGRIHIKLKNYRDALRLLQMSGDKARREKMLLDEELKAPPAEGAPALTAEKSGKMVSDSRRLSALADTALELAESARQQWMKNEISNAETVLRAHKGKSAEALRALLEEQGIDQKIINRYIPEQKKKKMFGLFGP